MKQQWGRVAVIGDIGGHLLELMDALVHLGANTDTWELPEDLAVVQVGDLIHRGPHSNEAVFFVDHVLRANPGRWAQLVGNHEQLYVADPVFAWPEVISDPAQNLLRHWWATGLMRPAAAITTREGPGWLATHAGLTAGLWSRLGSPRTAREAAHLLNTLDRSATSPLWWSGSMLGDTHPTLQAGPLWAAAPTELLPGWADPHGPLLPFHQVHGHSHAHDPATGRVWGPVHLAAVTTFDPATRHEVTTTPSGAVIAGVDPDHRRAPSRPWAPLVLHDAHLEPPTC